MKTSKFLSTAVFLSMAVIMWSCTQDEVAPIDELESSFLSDNSLMVTNSISGQLRDSGFGGPTAFVFSRFYGGTANGRSGINSPRHMMDQLQGRNYTGSRISEDVCYTVTFTEFDDGSYEYILDYGDGCEDYGEFMKGKLVETGSYTESTFEDHIEYFGFGGEDWEIDGTVDYEGTFETDELDSMVWSASYSFATDLVEKFIDFGYDDNGEESEDEELIEATYVANGTESMDDEGYTIESSTESYEISSGESFISTVDIPLFMDFTCDSESNDEYVWTFVSGVESGSYSYPSEEDASVNVEGTYSIDYGDGACDNIITITENGVSEEIDLGDEWDDWEEDCGGDDHEDGSAG